MLRPVGYQESWNAGRYADSDRLASSILQLITDKPLAAKLGTVARAAFDQSWHNDRTMAGYLALYDRTLSI